MFSFQPAHLVDFCKSVGHFNVKQIDKQLCTGFWENAFPLGQTTEITAKNNKFFAKTSFESSETDSRNESPRLAVKLYRRAAPNFCVFSNLRQPSARHFAPMFSGLRMKRECPNVDISFLSLFCRRAERKLFSQGHIKKISFFFDRGITIRFIYLRTSLKASFSLICLFFLERHYDRFMNHLILNFREPFFFDWKIEKKTIFGRYPGQTLLFRCFS